MVSVISPAVSLVVIGIVYGVLHVWGEVASTVFGNFVATFPSYSLNRKWAWGKNGRSHVRKEVVPSWLSPAAVIPSSTVAASIARHISVTHSLGHLESTALVLF